MFSHPHPFGISSSSSMEKMARYNACRRSSHQGSQVFKMNSGLPQRHYSDSNVLSPLRSNALPSHPGKERAYSFVASKPARINTSYTTAQRIPPYVPNHPSSPIPGSTTSFSSSSSSSSSPPSSPPSSSSSLYSHSPYLLNNSIVSRPVVEAPARLLHSFDGIPRPFLYLQHLEEVWGTAITDSEFMDMELEIVTRCNTFIHCREFHEEVKTTCLLTAIYRGKKAKPITKKRGKTETNKEIGKEKENLSVAHHKKEFFLSFTSKVSSSIPSLNLKKKKPLTVTATNANIEQPSKHVTFAKTNQALVYSIVDEIMYDLGIDLNRYQKTTETMNDVDVEIESLIEAIMQSDYDPKPISSPVKLAFIKPSPPTTTTKKVFNFPRPIKLEKVSPCLDASSIHASPSLFKNEVSQQQQQQKLQEANQTSLSPMFRWMSFTKIITKPSFLRRKTRDLKVVDSKTCISPLYSNDSLRTNSTKSIRGSHRYTTSPVVEIPAYTSKTNRLAKWSKKVKCMFTSFAV